MTKSTLESLATFPKLRSAWRVFWKNARLQSSSGTDGVTPDVFNVGLERNLASIRFDLLNGYRFDQLLAHPVPKPDGLTDRIICVPSVRDRLVQRLLGAHLSERAHRIGIINDASYGFIRGSDGRPRGVGAARDRALVLRRQHRWAYKSDISSFFDRIPRAHLFEQIVRSVRTPSLEEILWKAINCEIDTTNPLILRKIKKAGIKKNQGVRQGMPLSPFFANVILKNFDKELLRRDFPLVRYADDFIVFADSESECFEIDLHARKVLSRLDFSIPEIGDAKGKTQICRPDQGVDFLGLSISPRSGEDYSLVITEKQLEKIRRELGSGLIKSTI